MKSATPAHADRPPRFNSGLKTLIVDDEPVARKVLREDLESLGGVEVVGEADTGAAALDQIAGKHPDLVLLDLQMPGRLRSDPRDPPRRTHAGDCHCHRVRQVRT
jgi:CheY-like chemotaxis protein